MDHPYVPWSPLYEIGVRRIDEQHRGLAALVSDFYAVRATAEGRAQVFSVLNRLVRYAEEHFRDEEALMEAGRYPERGRQRLEHERFLGRVFTLAEGCERGEADITDEVMSFLKTWLLEHILHEDKKLEAYFQERGVPSAWA